MSFLGSFNPINIFKQIAAPIVSLAQGNVTKALSSFSTIVTTGGLSLVSPQIKSFVDPLVGKLYDPSLIPLAISATTHVPLLNAGGAYSVGPQPFTGSLTLPPTSTITPRAPIAERLALLHAMNPTPSLEGVQPMAFDISNVLGSVATIFGGNQNPVFNTVGNIAGLAQQFVPQPTYGPAPIPVAQRQQPPIVAPAMRAVGTVGRSFFSKYPNLAVIIQGYRNAGKNISRGKLWSLLKRFGPDVLISGGILTAASVSELIQAGPGRRRMNPGNVKALRRSLRRLESFHHLCQRVDKLRRPRARTKGGSGRGSQQFVRQG